MNACRNFKIREVDRKKKTFIEDWRKPLEKELENIYHLLVDDASSGILDRYDSGKSIIVFGVGRDNDKDYEVRKI